MDSKLMGVFKSRKFWAGVIGIAVALGLLNYGEQEQNNLVEAILTVLTTVSYIVATAIEDSGKAQGAGMANSGSNLIATDKVTVSTAPASTTVGNPEPVPGTSASALEVGDVVLKVER